MATLLEAATGKQHGTCQWWRAMAEKDMSRFLLNGGLHIEFDMESGPPDWLFRVVDTMWLEADAFNVCYRFLKHHFRSQWMKTHVPTVYTKHLRYLWSKVRRKKKMAAGVVPRSWYWFLLD